MSNNLPVSHLFVRGDARKLNDDSILGLVESIREVGIINPLRVRPARRYVNGIEADAYEVTAGAHRLHAARVLGLQEVPCIVVDDDDLHAELAMIDENLMRADLSPAEAAKATARRKEIYETLHPETRATSDGGAGRAMATRRQIGDDIAERFTSATAKATGKPERSVQRAAERGKSISEQALDKITGTHLDRGNYLDKLKSVPKDEQADKVTRDLAAPRKPISPAPAVRNEYESYQVFLNKVVKLFDGVPQEWREAACEHVLADTPVMDRGAA